MGTRGFIGFVIDGKEKLGYTHWGGYNEGVGVALLEFLRTHDLEEVRAQARALQVVSDAVEPTDAEIDKLQSSYNPSVGGPTDRPTWYQLLRENQDDPALILASGYVEDNAPFAQDSLFCEGGALVDFDTNRFEWYDGFQKSSHDKGRFASRPSLDDSGNYYPVALVASWPLDELPDVATFITATSINDDD